MILAKIDEEAVKQADILIHPNVNGIYLLSEKKSDVHRAVAAGEAAARAALPAIRARLSRRPAPADTASASLEPAPVSPQLK